MLEIQSALLAAEHDLGEDRERRSEDGQTEVLGRAGEVLADDGQRRFRAAVRDRRDDDTGEHDTDDGLADDESRGEQVPRRKPAFASSSPCFSFMCLRRK